MAWMELRQLIMKNSTISTAILLHAIDSACSCLLGFPDDHKLKRKGGGEYHSEYDHHGARSLLDILRIVSAAHSLGHVDIVECIIVVILFLTVGGHISYSSKTKISTIGRDFDRNGGGVLYCHVFDATDDG